MKIIIYALVFCFSLGACLPKSDFSQLLKINYLLQHYELHQQEAWAMGEVISFSDFLYLHFVDDDKHQHEDESKHENLPLHNISPTVIYYFLTTPEVLHFAKAPIEKQVVYYRAIFPISITADIFHPPQVT